MLPLLASCHRTSALPLNQIICGDALHVIRRLPDKSVDLVVTDPPYGDNIGYGVHSRTIAGNEHPLIGLSVMAECYRVLKANASAYMFCGARHLGFLRTFFQTYTKYSIRDVLIWDKMIRGQGHGFRRQYECILALEKGKPRYRSPGLPNVLRFQRVRAIRHPHEKPVELIEALIRQSSDEGNVVLDPFVGSGTITVAAKRIDRRYIGIELDPTYAQISEERLKQRDPLYAAHTACCLIPPPFPCRCHTLLCDLPYQLQLILSISNDLTYWRASANFIFRPSRLPRPHDTLRY